jgi:adenine-specific DNA-methyltransferase
MASLAKEISRKKQLGQVYTPTWIVQKILDDMGYAGKSMLGKSVLDPACGDGRFLIEVVKRIMENSPSGQLLSNLEAVHGWDIDKQAVALCIQNLDELVKPLHLSVRWKIEVEDALQKLPTGELFGTGEAQQFDFIVGNPPYIRIQHLAEDQRRFIQRHYRFCQSGSTDIYIAFYELAFHLISPEGIGGFITPNTFLFTETARTFRNHLKNARTLVQITNYGTLQLFENATTYSSIVIFDRQKKLGFTYQYALNQRELQSRNIHFEELPSDKNWALDLPHTPQKSGAPLGSIAKIHVGITTLCDRAYIFSASPLDETLAIAHTKLRGDVHIEKALLKEAVKGSTLKNSLDPIREYVLFPYKKINGKHQIIPESELASQFPLAYAYLVSVKEELDKRDNGRPNPVAWYAFGRSQGLDTSFGKKVIFSPMNNKPNFVLYENEDCTFYSGYCIKYKGDYVQLLPQLNSPEMERFIAASSRDFRNGWKAYNKKVVAEFRVNL